MLSTSTLLPTLAHSHIRAAKHGDEAWYITNFKPSELASESKFTILDIFSQLCGDKREGRLGREDSHMIRCHCDLTYGVWYLCVSCWDVRLSQSCIGSQLRHLTDDELSVTLLMSWWHRITCNSLYALILLRVKTQN